MSKLNVEDIEGRFLDWAVGFALCMKSNNGKIMQSYDMMNAAMKNGVAKTSTDWREAGILIDKYISSLDRMEDGRFRAGIDINSMPDSPAKEDWLRRYGMPSKRYYAYGDDFKVAAMRCLVTAIIGNIVEFPDQVELRLRRLDRLGDN